MDQDWKTKFNKIERIYNTARQEIAALRVQKRETVEKIRKEEDLAKAEVVRNKIKSL